MQNNVTIFNDTMNIVSDIETKKAIKYKGLLKNYTPKQLDKKTTFEIVNIDCIEKCILLSEKYKSICLLNNASEYKPGGGVLKGSTAQEEHVCRCTSLYPTIKNCNYPLHEDELLYSDKVYIVKDGKYKKINNIEISVITCAALRKPCLNKDGTYKKYDYDTMRAKAEMILETASYNNKSCLVLGAWGCGVFQNPYHQVADIFRELLHGKYKNVFEHVCFAILEKGTFEINEAFTKIFT